jgi:protein-disulfide isomerase
MKNIFAGLALFLLATGCVNKDNLKKTMVENPEILFEVIEKHPDKFLEVVNKAARDAQAKAREKQAQAEEQRLEDEFSNPKKPKVEGEVFIGKADAPIVIVEYSDFECPYCTRGYETVKRVKEVYGDKIKFVYKHLPLDFHPKALPAAKYFEAIALQDKDKAFRFHDTIFENQEKLKSGGDKWMEKVAKGMGVNMTKLKKDLESEKVKSKIDEHIAEARKFGITGTPGFIINGVTLKGAYPFPEFKKIIDRHLSKK